MALFGSKKNKEEAKDVKAPAKKSAEKAVKPVKADKPEKPKTGVVTTTGRDMSYVLRRPRITEKASVVSELNNAYVFDIDARSTKRDVIEAVKFFYKAQPVKVNMVTMKAKRVVVRGKKGLTSGGKKAYVYFKKGEKIEIL